MTAVALLPHRPAPLPHRPALLRNGGLGGS